MQDELIQSSEFHNSTWSHAALWFALLWAILLFIRKVSKDADNDLNPEKRNELSDELLRIKDRDASLWLPDFTSVFDRFFGAKHLSWRCFYRSSLISMVTLFTLLYLYDRGAINKFMIGEDILGEFITLFAYLLTLNVFLDYISLLETRVILFTRIPVLAKITVDAILTILIVILWVSFVASFAMIEMNYFEIVIFQWQSLYYASYDNSTFLRIVLATSLTTSIWLWLHGLSRILIRSLSNVQKFMGWLNVKETPLRAIGTTINLIVLTFGVLLFPVYLFNTI